MAISTYSELQSAVASWLHRSDLTTEIKDFIRLAEADLQVRARLEQWATSASVSLTSGVGSLPSDFHKAISVSYGSGKYTLEYLPKKQFDDAAAPAESSEPAWYTIVGSQIKVYPLVTGTVTLNYMAEFTYLSDSATTNSLLTMFPDAYLEGSLLQACVWTRDMEGMQIHAPLFDAAVQRVKKYVFNYSYPDGLQMRKA